MSSFADSLLAWYHEHRRVLPWREDPTPYHVYLSEIMLQQTRVDTVIPYYERFLNAYPDFASLAQAPIEDVYALWQGLGYYSRARNLHAAANIVVRDYGGTLPSSKEGLVSLPGVGDYVSSAIRAIAFNEKEVAVDGNLLRVYARLCASKDDISLATTKKKCDAFYRSRILSPSEFNQALMDLGELVCLPSGAPLCDQCPFKEVCKATQEGNPLDYPVKKKKTDVAKEKRTVLLVFDSDGAISIRKRPDQGLLASLYEFPNFEGHLSKTEISLAHPNLRDVTLLGEAKHRFSHILWDMKVYRAKGVMPGFESVCLEEIGQRYALPTAFLKLLKLGKEK